MASSGWGGVRVGGSTALHVSNNIATGLSLLSTQPLSAPLPPPHRLTHIDIQIATLLGIYWPLHTSCENLQILQVNNKYQQSIHFCF